MSLPGKQANGEFPLSSAEPAKVFLPGGNVVTLNPEGDLVKRSVSAPIPAGGVASGWLRQVFPGCTSEWSSSAAKEGKLVINLSVVDVAYAQTHSLPYRFKIE